MNNYATIRWHYCRDWINNPWHFQKNTFPVIQTRLKLDEHHANKRSLCSFENHPQVNGLQWVADQTTAVATPCTVLTQDRILQIFLYASTFDWNLLGIFWSFEKGTGFITYQHSPCHTSWCLIIGPCLNNNADLKPLFLSLHDSCSKSFMQRRWKEDFQWEKNPKAS